MADKDFRDSMADAVAHEARAEQALTRFTFHPVDPAEVDAFMAKAPEIAIQAEIGALISTDPDQIALDPELRTATRSPTPTTSGTPNGARPR